MKLPRFQFGLKVLFAVTTNVAVALGGWPIWTYDGFAITIATALQLSFLSLLAIWIWCGLDHVMVETSDEEPQ